MELRLGYCNAVSSDGSSCFFGSDDLFGKIDVLSGNVEFLENHGFEMGNSSLISSGERIFSLSKKYDAFIEYNIKKNEYKKIPVEGSDSTQCGKGIALAFFYDNKIFIFPRYYNKMLICDIKKREVRSQEYDVEGELIWACNYGEKVYLMTENEENDLKIFSLNLIRGEIRQYDFTVNSRAFKSKSSLPVHHMVCDGENIYYFDNRNIYCLDVEKGSNSLLYTSPWNDIGHRIAFIGSHIIVSPWKGAFFSILNRKTGEIEDVRCLPDMPGYTQYSQYGKTNAPCENERYIFWFVPYSDVMLRITKDTLEFVWIKLNFNSKNIRNIMEQKDILCESSIFTCTEFLTTISHNKTARNHSGKGAYVGKLVYES